MTVIGESRNHNLYFYLAGGATTFLAAYLISKKRRAGRTTTTTNIKSKSPKFGKEAFGLVMTDKTMKELDISHISNIMYFPPRLAAVGINCSLFEDATYPIDSCSLVIDALPETMTVTTLDIEKYIKNICPLFNGINGGVEIKALFVDPSVKTTTISSDKEKKSLEEDGEMLVVFTHRLKFEGGVAFVAAHQDSNTILMLNVIIRDTEQRNTTDECDILIDKIRTSLYINQQYFQDLGCNINNNNNNNGKNKNKGSLLCLEFATHTGLVVSMPADGRHIKVNNYNEGDNNNNNNNNNECDDEVKPPTSVTVSTCYFGTTEEEKEEKKEKGKNKYELNINAISTREELESEILSHFTYNNATSTTIVTTSKSHHTSDVSINDKTHTGDYIKIVAEDLEVGIRFSVPFGYVSGINSAQIDVTRQFPQFQNTKSRSLLLFSHCENNNNNNNDNINNNEPAVIFHFEKHYKLPDTWQFDPSASSRKEKQSVFKRNVFLHFVLPFISTGRSNVTCCTAGGNNNNNNNNIISRATSVDHLGEVDISGIRCVYFEQEIDGKICRTYVCPQNDWSNFLILRWETTVEEWSKTGRNEGPKGLLLFMDSVQIVGTNENGCNGKKRF